MDWGFGNPNITAALIVCLLVLAWLPAFLWRWGFWFSLPIAVVLGICLVHTMSRGGILGGFGGIATLAWLTPRPWPMKKLIAAGAGIWIVIFGAFWLNAHERLGQGIVHEDKSISHRLQIWKVAPQMLAAKPFGWGWNQSGQAYMDWYQPLDRNEIYGSLVNTHLSKVVELGLIGGSLYLFLWATVLLASWPDKQSKWKAIPFAMQVGFATAALFTNMARTPCVWIPPALCVVVVLVDCAIRKNTPKWRHVINAGFACIAVVVGFYFVGENKTSTLRFSKNIVYIGKGSPDCYVVVDSEKFASYPRDLREFCIKHPNTSLAVVKSIQELPDSLTKPVLITTPTTSFDRARLAKSKPPSVTFWSPQFSPVELPTGLKANAVYGEFSNSSYAVFWDEPKLTRRVSGVSDFIPDWTKNVIAPMLQLNANGM